MTSATTTSAARGPTPCSSAAKIGGPSAWPTKKPHAKSATAEPRADGASSVASVCIELCSMGWLAKGLTDEAKNAAVASLEAVAAELGITVAQLAIAWAARNPRVSTVITGASNVAQLRSNLAAVDAIAKLTAEVLARIDAITLPLAA